MSKKESPRLPPMETIITRHKSAMLKRQLRNKEISIKKINEMTQRLKSPTVQRSLLKSPVKAQKTANKPVPTKISPKKVKNVQKSPVKITPKKQKLSEVNVEKLEFYPDKLKRRIIHSKIVLKPKHDMKLIGSKRKKAVPQKGISDMSTMCKNNELSIFDLIEKADSDLDDEDFLEILTCPSPVWWEDPPDAQYIEEPLFTKSPQPEEITHKTLLSSENTLADEENLTVVLNDSKMFNSKNMDEKFMNKRTKLENVLGCIKNIKTDDSNTGSCKHNEGRMIQNNYKDIDEIKNDSRLSESTESDEAFLSLKDEFLDELENIDIPIETDFRPNTKMYEENAKSSVENKKGDAINSVTSVTVNSESQKSDVDSITRYSIAEALNKVVLLNRQSIPADKSKSDKIKSSKSSKMKKSNKNRKKVTTFGPQGLPIQHAVADELQIESNTVSSVPQSNSDETISTENTKPDTKTRKATGITKSSNRSLLKDKADIMAVYKTICQDKFPIYNKDNTDDTLNFTPNASTNSSVEKDRSDGVNSKNDGAKSTLDTFYKKYKNTYLKRPKAVPETITAPVLNPEEDNRLNHEIKSEDTTVSISETDRNTRNNCDKCDTVSKKTIDVRNSDKIKYCLTCSCIFDKDDCPYCLRKSENHQNKDGCVSCHSITNVDNGTKS